MPTVSRLGSPDKALVGRATVYSFVIELPHLPRHSSITSLFIGPRRSLTAFPYPL